MGKICPWCGKQIPRGVSHVCAKKPQSPNRRDRERERVRRSQEIWRQKYSDKRYKESRRLVISRSYGLCEACGSIVFVSTNRGWKRILKSSFSGTHHVVPLSKGGTNDPSNIIVLCARCHGIAHSVACDGIVSKAELIAQINRARI